MNQKPMLVVGAVVLILACSGLAFWLGRSSSVPAPDTPPPITGKPATAEPEIPNVEPTLSPGGRVEALSAEGWQMATIKEISGDQALIAYERSALGEERVDIRLLRKPEAELVSKSVPAPPPVRTPAVVTSPTTPTPPAPPLGPRPTSASKIPTGDYICEFDKGTLTMDTLTDESGAAIEITLTIEIVSDRVYRAFNGEDDNYSYDPASGNVTWENGMLGKEEPGQYRADSKSIVTSVGGHSMTCRLGR